MGPGEGAGPGAGPGCGVGPGLGGVEEKENDVVAENENELRENRENETELFSCENENELNDVLGGAIELKLVVGNEVELLFTEMSSEENCKEGNDREVKVTATYPGELCADTDMRSPPRNTNTPASPKVSATICAVCFCGYIK